ncbi:unnamed protein product [Ilex paraguariensis]|uniref:Uncharacterized protein n=1 Tax=Ilex paraguariensis TaxID=185542 RepID=A0ABC8U960_9AQUA
MAVHAVKSLVIQKLSDMLREGSVTFNIVMADQLKEMEEQLRQTGDYLIGAEEKQETDDDRKDWVKSYLLNLYNVEDAIEIFDLSIARQRKKLGFLMNYALFFKNLNACRKLRKKMKRTRARIKILNSTMSRRVDDISQRSFTTHSSFQSDRSLDNRESSISGGTHIGESSGAQGDQDQEEKEEQKAKKEEQEEKTGTLQLSSKPLLKHSGSAIPQVHTVRLERVNRFRILSKESRKRVHLQQRKLLFTNSYDEEQLGNLGFGEVVDGLVEQLTERDNRIVSIVGKRGSGKTTLARAIYKNRAIEGFFNCRAWISVSKEYSKADLLLSLLKQVSESKDQAAATEEVMQKRLLERLKTKRCLIVLDDVFIRDVWEKLKDAFPYTRKWTQIILTTCDIDVARYADPDGLPHHLNPLDNSASWDLLMKSAGLEETSPSSPDHVQQRILKICNGLPLNIVLLGGLLSTKKSSSYKEWNRVLSSQKNWDTTDILSLSINDLPFLSKLCLLYLALFPKEFDIPVRRLLRLWLAEGFMAQPDKVPEDVVQECFDDLVNRNLVQVSKLRSDGSYRRCRLQGTVHDYLLEKARDISLFYFHGSLDYHEDSAGPFGVRRIIEYVDIKKFSDFPHKLSHQRLRAYLSFNFQKKDTPAKEVGRFLSIIVGSGFGLLRVLDLEGVYRPNLPDKLGNLFHLRYLGLRWTFLDTLPQTVGDLPNLETLDIKHTYINTLPNSIWKLKHLRHLNLNGNHLDMPKQPHGLLKELLTLWGLFVDRKSPVKNGLNKLRDLRELELTFNLSSNEDLIDWIAGLTALQLLRLRSKDDRGRPSKLDWKPLSKLEKLSNLKLLGNFPSCTQENLTICKLPDPREFPPTLKVLTLSISQLNVDPMPTLGTLSELTVLRLLANSYCGTTMVCPRGTFTKLRDLKLWMLKELEEWNVEDEAMGSLKELNIRCCDKLKNIPNRLLQSNTLEELILTTMPKEFTDEVRQKKSNHTYLTVNHWKFSDLPWEEDDTSERNTECNGHSDSAMPTLLEARPVGCSE